MTFSRIKPLGWSVNEKLTSTQLNALDVDHANSLDKSIAGDTLLGKIQLSGQGRIVESVATGANADTTYYATSSKVILVTSAVSTYRVYTLSETNAVIGDMITIMATSAFGYWITVMDNASSLELCKIGHALNKTTYLSATFMFDGTRWRIRSGTNARGIRYQEFTSSTTWQCPQDVRSILVYGFGGGGGGGDGVPTDTTTDRFAIGGSGGGGSAASIRRINVTPGTTYDITVGAGGSAGSTGSYSAIGVSPSIITSFRGGGAGVSATSHNKASGLLQATSGGKPDLISGNVIGVTSGSGVSTGEIVNLYKFLVSGYSSNSQGGGGGTGSYYYAGSYGGGSAEGYSGGAPGATGSDSGTYNGGGGGGGGGAGPGGNGGAGGAGGAGNNAGAGGNGSNGSSASANTGAGGGGAGSAGFGSTSGGTGGTGGSGGSGFLAIWY